MGNAQLGMRAYRNRERDRQEEAEARRIMNGLASMKGYNANVNRRTAHKILMHSPLMVSGLLWEIECKHIGAGVYRIKLKDHHE